MAKGSGGAKGGSTIGVPGRYLPVEDKEGAAGDLARSSENEHGKKRNLHYPPAPEPLPFGVPDNHTHLDFRDGLVNVNFRRPWMLQTPWGFPA